MAVTSTRAQRKPLLPGGFGAAIRQLGYRMAGALLIVLAAIAWASLASWSIHDPSLNHATNVLPANWLGPIGAATADLALQSFGLAAIVLFLPLAAWGTHLFGANLPDRPWRRLLFWPVSVLAIAGGLSAIPAPESWPLPNGLGGIMGDLAMAVVRVLGLVLPTTLTYLVGGAAFLIAGSLGLLFASGISPAALAQLWPRFDAQSRERMIQSYGAAAGLLNRGRDAAAQFLNERSIREDGRVEPEIDRTAPQPVDESGRIEPFFENGVPQPAEPEIDYPATHDEEDVDEDVAIDGAPGDDDAEFDTLTQAMRAVDAGVAADTYIAPTEFTLPPLRHLKKPPRSASAKALSDAALHECAHQLESVLQDFGVKGEIVNVRPGPVVTLFELEPAPGTKSSRVIGLSDDIARSMSAISARVAVIPGRNAIGIELPNEERETVFLRELLEGDEFVEGSAELELALGKSIGGESVTVDLSRMPHLLIAGTTGSGKSVGINTMILSLLYRLTPDQCRFIMIDPKMLELSVYDGIPHLLAPVVTEPKKAVVALKWTVKEMEERYKKMSKLGVRNMHGYNARVIEARDKGEVITRTVQTGFDKETGKAVYEQETMDYEPMPYIVVIVDEMADLMMVAGKDIEGAVQRLAQMARAAGIHLIAATQRPSVDVVTGTIKANFPTRISFQVTSKIDSRTILGEQGAEQLLGRGDMLYMAGGGRIARIHGPFVSDEEVEKVVRSLKKQGVPQYQAAVTECNDESEGEAGADMGGGGNELYDQAVAVVLRDGKASTSYIQRRLSIGYNRAATLIERMEDEGVISSANHTGKREILVGDSANSSY